MRGPVTPTESPWPPVRPGFDHIARFWDNANGCCAARLLPGEYYVTRNDEMITTVLGSCVSACVRDPVSGIGGMNHFMLPASTSGDSSWNQLGLETRFGVAAMEQTVNELLKLGARRELLEFKLFGGGKIIEAMDLNDIGGSVTGFGLPRPGKLIVFAINAVRKGPKADEELEISHQQSRRILSEDQHIMDNIHYRVGYLTKGDRSLSKFLTYVRKYPRAHPSADFIR